MKKLAMLLLLAISFIAHSEVRLRPAEWAVPVIGATLDNFYSLDDKVYRSEQPDDEAFEELEAFGLKAVLNLRQHHTDDDEAEHTNLQLHHVKMNAGDVTVEEIVEALDIIKNSAGPILIHCWHGSDRTGIVSAAYRIVFQRWSKENAIEELREGGYGYHARIYPNIVDTLNSLDVGAARSRLGLPERRPSAN